jgi:hypothetical protein
MQFKFRKFIRQQPEELGYQGKGLILPRLESLCHWKGFLGRGLGTKKKQRVEARGGK